MLDPIPARFSLPLKSRESGTIARPIKSRQVFPGKAHRRENSRPRYIPGCPLLLSNSHDGCNDLQRITVISRRNRYR